MRCVVKALQVAGAIKKASSCFFRFFTGCSHFYWLLLALCAGVVGSFGPVPFGTDPFGTRQLATAQFKSGLFNVGQFNLGHFFQLPLAQAGSGDDHDHSGDDIYKCPEGKTLMAHEVKTPEDVRAFARCARDFIYNKADGGAESLQAAREAFHKDHDQWRSTENRIYVFLDKNTNDGALATSHIYPPDPNKYEGQAWGTLTDELGNSYFPEVYRIATEQGEGFSYYTWNEREDKTKPTLQNIKTSYLIRVNGAGGGAPTGIQGLPYHEDGYVLGVGIYPQGVANNCKPDKVVVDSITSKEGYFSGATAFAVNKAQGDLLNAWREYQMTYDKDEPFKQTTLYTEVARAEKRVKELRKELKPSTKWNWKNEADADTYTTAEEICDAYDIHEEAGDDDSKKKFKLLYAGRGSKRIYLKKECDDLCGERTRDKSENQIECGKKKVDDSSESQVWDGDSTLGKYRRLEEQKAKFKEDNSYIATLTRKVMEDNEDPSEEGPILKKEFLLAKIAYYEAQATKSLQDFVRCAAVEYQAQRAKGKSDDAVLEEFKKSGSRWRHNNIYLFGLGLDATKEKANRHGDQPVDSEWIADNGSKKFVFNARPDSFARKGRGNKAIDKGLEALDWQSVGDSKKAEISLRPTTTDDGKNYRQVIGPAAAMGESFLYYPAVGHYYEVKNQKAGTDGEPDKVGHKSIKRKVSFLKRFTVDGKPMLIGAGFYLPYSNSDGNKNQIWAGGVQRLGPLDCNDRTRADTDTAGQGVHRRASRGRIIRKATAIETRDDLRSFVQQARCTVYKYLLKNEYLGKNGNNGWKKDARDQFKEEPKWYDTERDIYVFIDDRSDSQTDVVHVFPPTDLSGDRQVSSFTDFFANDPHSEMYRILKWFGSTFTYYSFNTKEATENNDDRHRNRNAKLKATFVAQLAARDLPQNNHTLYNKTPLIIGAGLYERGTPGACLQNRNHVTADALNTMTRTGSFTDTQMLKDFVACAALSLEEGVATLANMQAQTMPAVNGEMADESADEEVVDPNRGRWAAGGIYLFGLRQDGEQFLTNTGQTAEWAGQTGPPSAASATSSSYDALKAIEAVGEGWVYYMRNGQKKRSYLKRIMYGGEAAYIGAGLVD